MTAPPLDSLAFAEKLLSLLDTGRKTATYKFATLMALVDLCVERAADENATIEMSAREVGRRAFEIYWRQAVPYTADESGQRFLSHSVLSRDRQPDLVVKIERFRQRHHLPGGVTPARAASLVPDEFGALLDEVVITIIRMPLPKLQRFNVGGKTVEDRFLYEYGWPDEVPAGIVRRASFDDTLRLQPGVAAMLARLGGLLRPVIEARWAAYVSDRSRDLIERSDITDFLFGASRILLTPVRDALLDLQDGRCFYCRQEMRTRADIDHFIPWARHPDNGIDNLVAAHSTCNNHKRDSLAATSHLKRWIDRNEGQGSELAAIAANTKWSHLPDRTLGAARSTYRWLPERTSLWVREWEYEPLNRTTVQKLLRVIA
jgi:5-methylcytosine-specific restriction endonuclease McrA